MALQAALPALLSQHISLVDSSPESSELPVCRKGFLFPTSCRGTNSCA